MNKLPSKNKPKVLIFIDWYAPGFNSGGPVRSMVNMIENLHQSIDFYLVTRNTDYLSDKPYPNIKANQWTKTNNAYVWYFSKQQLNFKNITKILHQNKFDYLYINGIFSFYFSLMPLFLFSDKSKIVLAPRGMFSQQATAVKSIKKRVFFSVMKNLGAYKKISYHATSETEINDIKQFQVLENRIFLAPNLTRSIKLKLKLKKKQSGKLKLIFLGRIAQEKNILFLLKILTTIEYSQIELDIYGGVYDKEYWKKCLRLIEQLPNKITVEYKNVLSSEKVLQTLTEYHFMVLPSLGENFGHSIAESLSVGTPVLVSTKTPWQNLAQHNAGFDIDLQNTEQWTQTIQYLSTLETQEYNQMQLACYQYAQQRLSKQQATTITKYLTMFETNDNTPIAKP